MSKMITAKRRRTTKSNSLPGELIGRLQSLYEHNNLREQRDTFSAVFKHPGGTFRWNTHLMLVPYFHIIESESFGKHLRLHVFHVQSGNILSAEFKNEKWTRLALTPDDRIRDIIPSRFCRTGWLAKSASRAQIGAVARVRGVQQQALPPITAANANVIIHSAELARHMDEISTLFAYWINEIQASNNRKII